MTSAHDVLGCAQSYTAELAYVIRADGDGTPLPKATRYTFGELSDITSLSYNRVLNGVSECDITVGGISGRPPCCDEIGRLQPWVWELRLWRDGVIAWEGVLKKPAQVTKRGAATLSFVDVLGWFDGDNAIHNMVTVSYDDRDPAYIGQRIITRALSGAYVSPPDSPLILDYLWTRDVGEGVDYKPGLEVVPVLSMLDDLTDQGLSYTALGRSVMLFGAADSGTPSSGLLTSDSFADAIEVAWDGDAVATIGVAVRPGKGQDVPPTVFTYGTPNAYGTRMRVVDIEQDDSDASARKSAKNARKGRTSPPLTVTPLSGAKLLPTAPIDFAHLIPGWARVDIVVPDICPPLRQPSRIVEVNVDYAPGVEDITISTASIGRPTDITPEAVSTDA